MLSVLILAVVPLMVLLPLCILVEVLSRKPGSVVESRYPGAAFVLLLPIAIFLIAWPFNQMWKAVGVQPLVDLSAIHPVNAIVALVVLHDFLRYWGHRFEHRFWWPVHAVHHSIRDLHAANSYGHPLMAIPEFFFVAIPLSFIDMGGVSTPTAVALIMALQNLIIHSPLDVHHGPLRNVIVDSRFHRIHHSLEPEHFDRNFAFTFSIWDRLFGTAHFPKNDEWPDVGIEGLAPPLTWQDYLAHPLRHFSVKSSIGQRIANHK